MKIILPNQILDNLKWSHANRVRGLIVLSVLGLVFLLHEFSVLQRFELVTYDYRCLLRGSRPSQPEIVIIEISDDSIAAIGRWPWDRDWHASLIKILKKLEARAVIFDVIFSEKSSAEKDAVLVDAIKSAQNVYLAQVVEDRPSQGRVELLESLPEFRNNAKGNGHINLYPDEDGVMRRIPLFMQVNGQKVPQLSFAAVMDYYELKASEILYKKDSMILPIKGGALTVPMDPKGNMILNWAGRWHETYKHYSYIDVIRSYALVQAGKKPIIPLDSLRGKFCFIGTTASGLFDIRPMPLQPLYPAVGVNLTILNSMLEKKFIHQSSPLQDRIIFLIIAISLFFIASSPIYFRNALLTMLLLLGYWFLAALAFIFLGWWVTLIYPTVLVTAIYFGLTLYNQLSVAIERARLLKMATRDSLTGLYNIGQFKLLLKAELTTLAIRSNQRVMSILMSDADDFKRTNDTYGHQTGDQVLRELANVIKTTCRALDVAARYGGEEFIVMLPGASELDAEKIAEKIRLALSQKMFHHEKGDFSTTISIGVTQARAGEMDIQSLVERADKALYEAKHSGKNKVIVYREKILGKI